MLCHHENIVCFMFDIISVHYKVTSWNYLQAIQSGHCDKANVTDLGISPGLIMLEWKDRYGWPGIGKGVRLFGSCYCLGIERYFLIPCSDVDAMPGSRNYWLRSSCVFIEGLLPDAVFHLLFFLYFFNSLLLWISAGPGNETTPQICLCGREGRGASPQHVRDANRISRLFITE